MSAPTMAETAQLDRIEAHVASIVAELEATRRERDRWRELTHELMPVAQGAMTLASTELEDLSQDVTVEDAVRFLRAAVRALPRLEALLAQLDSVAELAHEATSLTGAGVSTLSQTLANAEQRGYFAFARTAAGVLDEMVTSFAEADTAPPPSMLHLLRQLRDPQVRRGMSRTLTVVGDLGAATASRPSTQG